MSFAVSLRQVVKHYRRGKESVEVLHGLNLEIPEGEFVSLMGPSGSGKTTILNLVGGSAGWWLALTTMIGLFHTKIDEKAMKMINRACGLLVIGCGLAVLIHLAWKFA